MRFSLFAANMATLAILMLHYSAEVQAVQLVGSHVTDETDEHETMSQASELCKSCAEGYGITIEKEEPVTLSQDDDDEAGEMTEGGAVKMGKLSQSESTAHANTESNDDSEGPLAKFMTQVDQFMPWTNQYNQYQGYGGYPIFTYESPFYNIFLVVLGTGCCFICLCCFQCGRDLTSGFKEGVALY